MDSSATPYINLQSDYGFKRAFGTEKFKKALIRLLDVALGNEISVKEVHYHNKEVIPNEEDGKRILFDVYCTVKTTRGESSFFPRDSRNNEKKGAEALHHFILEMQNIYSSPFEDRMCYYATKMIADQGRRGWNYDLDPVILIAVTDFDFPHMKPQLVQDVQLRERKTGELLTGKLKMLFLSLKQVAHSWEECHSELERILYLIKNMEKMDKNSEAYKSREYDELFEAAESGDIVGEDAVRYSNSLAYLREVQAGLDYRYEQGYEKGVHKGRTDAAVEIAKNMLKLNIDLPDIANITGLSIDRITNL